MTYWLDAVGMSRQDSSVSNRQSRRSLLKLLGGTGAAGMAGLAGCAGSGDGGSDGGGSGDGDSDGSSGDGGSGDGGSTSTTTSTSSSGGESVKVGFLHPLTGPLSAGGEAQERGAKIAVSHVNEDLGGIGGRPVEAVYEDTETDPATGREKARKLVENDDVDVLIGAVSGAVSLSVADYAYDAQTIYFPYGGSESITGSECKPTTFRYQYSASQSARAGAKWALENLGTNVWIHFADYSFGQSIRDTWRAAMEESGIDHNVVNVTKTPLGTSDYSSYISQIQSSEADWVLQAFSGSDAINFLKQAEQFGMKESVDIMSSLNAYQPLRQGAGTAAVGTYGLIRYNRRYDSPENQALIDRHVAAYDTPPTDHALNMWTCLRLYAKGVDQAGSLELGDVIPALEGMESEEPMGPVTLRACDHQAVRDYPIGEIVEPTDYEWPDLKINATLPGDQITESCEESQCDMPSL